MTKEKDTSTEEKIKNAARKVFHKKGYSATRTRDIAEEAGINLALLNYYFRSKHKLFEIIMLEGLHSFLSSVALVFNEEHTSLEEKLEKVVDGFIDLYIQQPDLPLFIMSELKENFDNFIGQVPIKNMIMKSHFFKQLQGGIAEGKYINTHPFQILASFMGLIIFPFAAHPMMRHLGDLSMDEFNALMLERKRLIPIWMSAILNPI